jgi:hypothetical protein
MQKKELEKSHKNINYTCAMIWFKDLDLNHFFVVLPGEPGIVWVRNDPLTSSKGFHILWSQISGSPCYLSSGNSFLSGKHVTLTTNRKEALTFHWKRISERITKCKEILENNDIIYLCTEDGECLEAFWSGIFLVQEKESYGWKVILSNQSESQNNTQIHIDDTVTLVSKKYADQKLIWQGGSLTTSNSSGYWRFCYAE